MTPRSLFNIILKVFGLFFLREVINSVLQTISTFYFYFSGSGSGQLFSAVVVSLGVTALYIILVLQILFKTNQIIDYLKLDQGFEENELSFDEDSGFLIRLSTTTIITIALLVIGGVILVDEVPDFCKHLYLYFSVADGGYSNTGYTLTQSEIQSLIFSGVKILIALLIIGEHHRIISFVESRKKMPAEEEEQNDENPE